jgi:hypothetical protein
MTGADLMETYMGKMAWPQFLRVLVETLEDPEITPGYRNRNALELLKGARPVPELGPEPIPAAEEPRGLGPGVPGLSGLLREAAEATALITLGQAMQGGVASDLPARLASAAEGAEQ